MEWWTWILLGLLLLLAEIVTPGGFYIIFFGVGAVVVGVLAGFDAAGPLNLPNAAATSAFCCSWCLA